VSTDWRIIIQTIVGACQASFGASSGVGVEGSGESASKCRDANAKKNTHDGHTMDDVIVGGDFSSCAHIGAARVTRSLICTDM